MIKEINHKFFVYSHTGTKRLSKGYPSLKQAKHRLQVIEAFKHGWKPKRLGG